MLKIMYGSIPNSLELTDLLGKKFQNHTILKTKFIAETAEDCIFCALVCDCDNPKGEDISFISNAIYKCPSKKKTPVLTTNTKKSRKKFYRLLNNQTLNEDNWKQFIGSRNLILASVIQGLAPRLPSTENIHFKRDSFPLNPKEHDNRVNSTP